MVTGLIMMIISVYTNTESLLYTRNKYNVMCLYLNDKKKKRTVDIYLFIFQKTHVYLYTRGGPGMSQFKGPFAQ